MDNSNKAIAKRINKELKIRDWKQTDLLRKIIKFKEPGITDTGLYIECNKKKGNFSTTLRGKEDRSIPKEDLYIISKIFGVSLEYIWFGDEKKDGFVPNGARYAAYQDTDSAYRSYIADLEYEDRIQYPDESGFNLFDYFGQYDSINGYKFFDKNYCLYFDYTHYGQLMYINGDGHSQFCSQSDRQNVTTDNLLITLIKHKAVKTFKNIFIENCSPSRFDLTLHFDRNKVLFSDSFLDTLLMHSEFLEQLFKIVEIDISLFSRHYEKGEKRFFVEPLFFETISYALKHEIDYKDQLLKMLKFALNYNKEQFEFVKRYLEKYKDIEYGDVRIYEYNPRFLTSSRNLPMGNIFDIKCKLEDKVLNNLAKEIEQYAFNIAHIINEQEKNNEEIKIVTPNNELFIELCKNSARENVTFMPMVAHSTKEFTYFYYYEPSRINFESPEHLKLIIDCLNKAQTLVTAKTNKVLVHGNLSSAVLMANNGKIVGLAGWQKCYYGSKYDDRSEILANIDYQYSFGDEYLDKFKVLFEIITQGFSQEEKLKLIERAITLLNQRVETILKEKNGSISKAYQFNERAAKLEFFKKLISK